MSNPVRIKTFTSKVGSGATPRGGDTVYKKEGISLIRSQNVLDLQFSESGLAYIDNAQAKKLDNVTVQQSDVLLNITGDSIARVCRVPNKILPARVNQHVSIIRCKDSSDSAYLMYYLHNLKSYLLRLCKVGGTRNALTKEAVENLPVIIQKNSRQRAAVLSALDAKIELNNRINAELEAMAKTLYDYWFVQFNFPDTNGRPYKSSVGKMVYNPILKREIPEVWEVEPLVDCCSVIDCLHSKKPEVLFEAEKFYLLQLENILDNGLLDVTTKYHVSKADYGTWISRIEIRNHDVVMTNAGRIAAFAQVSEHIVCGIGRNITAIRPNSISPNYFFLSLAGLDVQKQILSNLDHGAFFKSFNVKGIKIIQLLRPKDKIESDFEKMVTPIVKKRHLIINETQQLVSLRDFLLPMLMNGQVSVGQEEVESSTRHNSSPPFCPRL